MRGNEAETRDRQSLEGGHREILERLRASAAATFGEERVTEASVRDALEASARAVWLVDSEPLDPRGAEPHHHD
ncbi:MAG: hypothetical protein M3P51_10385 [Chloroflexota bacterium]|nr:hypothetical protein [Chloroflexota bacterium]